METEPSVKVEFNGESRVVFRAGNDFEIKSGEVRIDKATGNVKPTHGVSINVDAEKMQDLAKNERIRRSLQNRLST